MNWLSGKKTYIGIIVGTVLALLGVFGVVPPDSPVVQAVAVLVATWTGVSLTLHVTKSGT